MKLTKAQRHECYTQAVKMHETGMKNFMCSSLSGALKSIGIEKEVSSYEVIDFYFPELVAKRPIITETVNCWWNIYEQKQRIKVLRACIRETAPRKKAKKQK